jgi:hypothetical protein
LTKPETHILLKTFYFDVKDRVSVRSRFEVPFAFDDEAIQHSKDLAARFRQRHVHDEPGLMISVLDQSGRKIHEEFVYPDGQARS